MSLALALEWKYGPIANTGSVVVTELPCDNIKETDLHYVLETFYNYDEIVRDENGEPKRDDEGQIIKETKQGITENSIIKDYVLEIDVANKMAKMLQVHADLYKLPYSSENIEMVITSWRHPSISQPDGAQLEQDISEYEVFVASQAYRGQRKAEYPEIGDQLDALWKVIDVTGHSEAEELKAQIDAVKTKYPKS